MIEGYQTTQADLGPWGVGKNGTEKNGTLFIFYVYLLKKLERNFENTIYSCNIATYKYSVC